MTYCTPTADDLRARCPAFARAAHDMTSHWLTDAQREAGDSWGIASDIAPARIAVAAHDMMTAGVAAVATSPDKGSPASRHTGMA